MRLGVEEPEGCSVTWRGYIANRRDFGAGSDGARFVRAYRRWGADVQAHVTGEYAVAISEGEKTVLTHDALGIVPIFYSWERGHLAFSFRLEDLARGRGLDEEYIAHHLLYGTPAGDRTPFHGVRRLRQGRTLVLEGARLVERDTWDLSRAPDVRCRDVEERFLELLSEGVAAAAADGPAWTELSGGLDSSTIACVASRLDAPGLAAVSLLYPGMRSTDEERWMREVVDRCGIPWHRLANVMPFSSLPDRPCAEPYWLMSISDRFRAYERLLGENGVPVLMSGLGGDQVMGGDAPEPHHLADDFPHRALGEIRAWRALRPGSRSTMFWVLQHVLRPLARRWLGRAVEPDSAARPPWMAESLAARAREAREPAVRCRTVGLQAFRERLHALTSGLSECGQYASGFEFRYPLLYRPLVEFMAALPAERKLRPGIDRCLQRKALRGILPEAVRKRPRKTGYDQVFAEGLRGSRAWLDALSRDPRIVERGYAEPLRWREAVARARYGKFDLSFVAAASLEVWLRQFEGPEWKEVRHVA